MRNAEKFWPRLKANIGRESWVKAALGKYCPSSHPGITRDGIPVVYRPNNQRWFRGQGNPMLCFNWWIFFLFPSKEDGERGRERGTSHPPILPRPLSPRPRRKSSSRPSLNLCQLRVASRTGTVSWDFSDPHLSFFVIFSGSLSLCRDVSDFAEIFISNINDPSTVTNHSAGHATIFSLLDKWQHVRVSATAN